MSSIKKDETTSDLLTLVFAHLGIFTAFLPVVHELLNRFSRTIPLNQQNSAVNLHEFNYWNAQLQSMDV
jgi:hypothetical protein